MSGWRTILIACGGIVGFGAAFIPGWWGLVIIGAVIVAIHASFQMAGRSLGD